MTDKTGKQKTKLGRPRRESRVITKQERKKIREAAKSLQEKIIIYLIMDTGARRSDIARIRIENIKRDEMYIEIIQKKTGKKANPIITKKSLEWLETYIYDHLKGRTKGYLFPSPRKGRTHLSGKQIYNILKRVTDRAGITDITPHDLRATRITSRKMDGFSDKAVSDEMGVSIKTAKRHYEKYSPEQLREMDEKARRRRKEE